MRTATERFDILVNNVGIITMRPCPRCRMPGSTASAAFTVPQKPYTAAKFSAVGFSEGLAAEVAADGVRARRLCRGSCAPARFSTPGSGAKRQQEVTWFSLGSALPFVSMDAERAARQIVAAMRRGEALRVLSLPAILLARLHGAASPTTVRVMALVNRMLPRAVGAVTGDEPGWQVDRALDSPALRAATALGRRAARRFNERAS